ncbi:MAG: DUF2441 domain-containing protein [Bacteroidetes bacterium]|nr:DUF2441 domain-containing protein [Bacteroidota bacterium]
MEVKDEIFYHCQRKNGLNKNWEIGDFINFSKKTENYYFSSLKECVLELKNSLSNIDLNPKIEKIEGIIHNEEFEKNIREKQILINNSKYYIDQINDYFNKTIQFQQETIFEFIRKEINPQLPSRQSCIWITETIEDLRKWSDMFKCPTILKLKLNGKIHKTSGKFIDIIQNRDLYTARLNATEYWRGKYNDRDEIEFLFEGNFEIVDKIK